MNLINTLILWFMQRQLNKLRKKQNTPYIYIKGTSKDYPKYLMYTDDEVVRNKMHAIN